MGNHHHLSRCGAEPHDVVRAVAGNPCTEEYWSLTGSNTGHCGEAVYNLPSVRREGPDWRYRVRLSKVPCLAPDLHFIHCVSAGIKVIADGDLDAAVRAQQCDLRSAVAVINKRTQGHGRGVDGQGNRRQLHGGRAQNLDPAAGEERSVRAGTPKICKKNVRGRSAERVASQRCKAFGCCLINQQRERTLLAGDTHHQGGLVLVAEITCRQSGDSARQMDDLRRRKVALAVAREKLQGIPTLGRNYQILIALSGETADGNEIRPDWHTENSRFGKKRRGKLTAANGLKRCVALGSKGVQVAAMKCDDAASRRCVANDQVLDSVYKISLGHG